MNCDRIARLYRFGERLIFGGALERCRTTHLSSPQTCEAALVCGDGDGRFLRALVDSGRAREIDYVDVSPRMTALARTRADRSDRVGTARVTFFCADIRTVTPPRRYDLIATHFFLDCFEEHEIDAVVRKIAVGATEHATWLVSEFQIPERRLARSAGTIVVGALYAVFGILTGLRARRLPDYRAALASCGFHCATDVSSCGGLLTAQLWRRRPTVNGAAATAFGFGRDRPACPRTASADAAMNRPV
jgi:SAM-dependent methyltransferase